MRQPSTAGWGARRPACLAPAERAAAEGQGKSSLTPFILGEGLGVAVDVYHVWWDPKLENQIRRAGKRILAYHICDWLVPTRDLLSDRGMMGEGVVDLPLIRSWVEAAGYSSFQEVEIFSELDWWTRDPDEVLRTCMERHARCC